MTIPPQPWPSQATTPPRQQTGKIIRVLTFVLSVAALAVAISALARPAPHPTYTASEKSAAQERLCAQYKLAAQAAHIETALDGDVALARISMINGALILESAAADPALAANYRDAARALADAYQTMAATGSLGDDEKFKATVDATNARVGAMKNLCGD
ncbi:hypothetical protein [Mycolicibacter minnesotensis]